MLGKETNKKFALIFFLIVTTIGFVYLISNSTSPKIVTKDWVGISLHELSKDEARIVKDSTASWIRIDVFTENENALENAKDQDLKILAILDSWMFNKGINFTLDQWNDTVSFYVSQYADLIDAWEIWNEPAHPNYTLSAEKYYLMAQMAFPVIRQYDPSAKILLFGGLHLWSGDDSHRELDMEFAHQLAVMNIQEYGDAISLHAYPWMDKVESWIWEKYDESLAYYNEVFPSLELWITETGHPIEGDGENGQAQYMRDALQYFQGKAAKLFWYSLIDNSWEQNRFGLINNGIPRLAYHELQKEVN